MKYDERASWAVDMEIVSDKALSSPQIDFCLSKLGETIGATSDLIEHTEDNGDIWGTMDGVHGGLEYNTDQHHFHCINIWANEHADLKSIMQIVCTMCSEGCRATCWDGYTEKSKRLANFDYELRKVY